ncbi:MAG: hypothetical protein U0704_16540 [Candidatus Eisenbacteria bacterium]
MSANNQVGRERARLKFADAVSKHFAFLGRLGFSEVESLPTLVRYGRGDLEVAIYHGRRSFEIGLEITRLGTCYSIEELIRIAHPELAAQYRNYQTTTPHGIAQGLAQLAGLVKKHGERALTSDPVFFAALDHQRRSWAEGYALDVLAGQLRPKAAAAFRSGDYRQAADLYERIHARLTAVELKKLALAKDRAGL